MEFGEHSGVSTDEVHEMYLMSLQDHEPDEAAYFVLKYVFG